MTHNRAFHFVIYDAPESRYLANMIAGLWDLSERYRYRYMYIKDQGAAVQREHRDILEACRKRDAKELRNMIIQHMRHTLLSIREYIAREHGD